MKLLSNKPRIILLILFLIIFTLELIYSHSSNQPDKDHEYSNMQKEIKRLKDENSLLQEQVLTFESFTHIHKYSVDNLHMVEPTVIFLH